jgi:hypothetical protein
MEEPKKINQEAWDAGYDKDMINRVSLNPKLSETNRRIQCSFPRRVWQKLVETHADVHKEKQFMQAIRHMMGER